MIGDQLLEVNGRSLVGVSNDRFDTQIFLKFIVALIVLSLVYNLIERHTTCTT